MAKRPQSARSYIALSLQLGADGEVPREFRVFAMGINKSEKGDFLFDDQAAADVMQEYLRHNKPLLMDYNHGTTFPNPTPEQAKASAKSFVPEVRDDGLWATQVDWTPQAQEYLKTGEYSLHSPLFDYDRKTNRITRLINVALTNRPALDNIVPIAASANPTGEDVMNEEELKKLQGRVAELETSVKDRDAKIKALEGQTATVALSAVVGLSANASDAEVRSAVASLTGFRREVLSIVGKETDSTAIGALTVLKDRATETVALRAEVETAKTAALSAEWSSFLDGLSTKGADGKFLTPAKRKTADRMALSMGGGKLTAEGIAEAKGFVTDMLEPGTPSGKATEPPEKRTVALSSVQTEIIETFGWQSDKTERFMKFIAEQPTA